jgi:putative SOS response-associated peptidase YedK
VHAKAMPAILTTLAEMDQWMTAPAAEVLELQRPLPDDALQIVMRGQKEDARCPQSVGADKICSSEVFQA